MRERPDLTYSVVAAIFLIILVWHPAHVFTRPLALVLLAVLLVVGTEALRRETAREFPDATLPSGGIRQSFAAWRSGSSRGAPAKPAPSDGPQLDQLERLAGLRDRGVLTQQEFEAQKAALLAR
jgi:hypothetical protein